MSSIAAADKVAPQIKQDWLVALGIGILAAVLSIAILNDLGTVFFYQNFAPETIYEACGLGFRHPGDIPVVLRDFLLTRSQSFDCSLLDSSAPLNPPAYFARLQVYLSHAISLFWHGPILEYRALWPLVGVFGGAYASGGFVLLRLFLPRSLAALGGILVAISPIALTLALSFRDYSKAPFFIWGMIFLICTIRAPSFGKSCLWSVAAGATAGLGLGFRGDITVLMLAGFVALLAVTQWSDLKTRIPAFLVFAATTLIVALPILTVSSGASYGSVMIQGQSDPFQRFLGLEPPLYSLGARYSDELTFSSVAAAQRPLVPDWDENEAQARYGISQSIKLSGEDALSWMPLFIGDLATQGLKGLAWLAAMPALVGEGRPIDPSFGRTVQSIYALPGQFIYAVVGHAWLVPLGIFGLLMFSWREISLRPQFFPATVLLVGLVASSTVVQFAVRHVFHLEFLWPLALFSIIMAVVDRKRLRSTQKPFLIGVGVLFLIGGAAYGSLLYLQQKALEKSFADLLDLPREMVATEGTLATIDSGTSLMLEIPVPNEHADIVRAADDSMNDGMPFGGLQWDVRAEADRFVLSLENCPAADYMVNVRYQKAPNVWQPMDDTIPVHLSEDVGTTQIVFAGFYRPTQHVSNVTISPFPASCNVLLQKLRGATPLPYLLTASFPPNWRDRHLFRNPGGFGPTWW